MYERDDEVIERVARELRRPVRLDPAFDARVMTEIRESGDPGTRDYRDSGPGTGDWGGNGSHMRAWRWLTRPHTVRVSPLGGLASAAAIAVAVALVGRLGSSGQGGGLQGAGVARPPVIEAATRPQSIVPGPRSLVQFVLVAPGARTVSVVGDFNDWRVDAVPLRSAAAGGGVWTVEVPLAPGRHRYAFVVDGSRWTPDPAAPTAPGDDFGTPSSVVTVVERQT